METFFINKTPEGEILPGLICVSTYYKICQRSSSSGALCNQNATKQAVRPLNKGFTLGSNPMSSAITGNKVLEPCSRFFLYLWAFSKISFLFAVTGKRLKNQKNNYLCNQDATKNLEHL